MTNLYPVAIATPVIPHFLAVCPTGQGQHLVGVHRPSMLLATWGKANKVCPSIFQQYVLGKMFMPKGQGGMA
jgi:hypothetical protein